MRTDLLVIKLTRTEKEAVRKLAELEHLSASTLTRRLLLFEAERQGLLVPGKVVLQPGHREKG